MFQFQSLLSHFEVGLGVFCSRLLRFEQGGGELTSGSGDRVTCVQRNGTVGSDGIDRSGKHVLEHGWRVVGGTQGAVVDI